MKKMHIENGFTVKLVKSELLIAAPLVIEFHYRGQIWVVEMSDYLRGTIISCLMQLAIVNSGDPQNRAWIRQIRVYKTLTPSSIPKISEDEEGD